MWKVLIFLSYFYGCILTATIPENCLYSNITNEFVCANESQPRVLDNSTLYNVSNVEFENSTTGIIELDSAIIVEAHEILDVQLDNRSRKGYSSGGWANCANCGLVHRNRIVGGRKASIGEFPWMVSIHKNGAQHCGGAVLDRMHILTAAHCLKGVKLNQLVIIASAANVYDRSAFRTRPLSALVNNQFEPETYDYDIAVLTLVDPIPLHQGYIRPICLPNPSDNPIGEIGIVSGWGALAETSNVAPETLQKVELPIVSNSECKKATGLKSQVVTDRMMCAGYIKGNRDACSGDSGGPLIWENHGRWVQIGIVSWGIGCARENYYGVFTKMTAMLPWVHRHVQNTGCK